MRVVPLLFACLTVASLFFAAPARADTTDAELLARPLTLPAPPSPSPTAPAARNEPALGPMLVMVGAAGFATGYLGTLAVSRYSDALRPDRPWDARVAIPLAGSFFAFARLPKQGDPSVVYSMMLSWAAATQVASLAFLGYGATLTIRGSRVAVVPAPNGLVLGGAF